MAAGGHFMAKHDPHFGPNGVLVLEWARALSHTFPAAMSYRVSELKLRALVYFKTNHLPSTVEARVEEMEADVSQRMEAIIAANPKMPAEARQRLLRYSGLEEQ